MPVELITYHIYLLIGLLMVFRTNQAVLVSISMALVFFNPGSIVMDLSKDIYLQVYSSVGINVS